MGRAQDQQKPSGGRTYYRRWVARQRVGNWEEAAVQEDGGDPDGVKGPAPEARTDAQK